MNIPNKEEIIDFVHDTYGKEASKKLKNIYTGGNNNQKGRDYENQFLLYKVFEIANKYSHDCANQFIASQEIAFVDDICYIDYEANKKYNFQAKNSSGDAAKWTEDISDRFRKQRKLDTEMFKINHTVNCLLVSDEQKALSNKAIIPDDLKYADTCEYFKYHSNIYDLVYNTKLYDYITNLIDRPSNSECDYAATLIHGALQSGKHNTVKDIFMQAQSDARPNPFIKFRTVTTKVPEWLDKILTEYSHCVVYSLNYGKLVITVNGMFEVTSDLQLLSNLPASKIHQITNIQELVSLMLSVTGQSINQPSSSSKLGETK